MVRTVYVKLLGREWPADHKSGNPHWFARVDLTGKWDGPGPLDVDWTQIPEDGFSVEGKPVYVRIELQGGMSIYYSMDELRQRGEEIVFAERQPNAARLKEIRESLETCRRTCEETLKKKLPLLRFSFNRDRNSWQAVVWEENFRGKTRVVYTVPDRHYHRVRAGVLYACTIERVAVDHPPQGERNGFQLVVVNSLWEHIDPDVEIPLLEAEIANGRP